MADILIPQQPRSICNKFDPGFMLTTVLINFPIIFFSLFIIGLLTILLTIRDPLVKKYVLKKYILWSFLIGIILIGGLFGLSVLLGGNILFPLLHGKIWIMPNCI